MTVPERITLAQDILESLSADQAMPHLSEAKREELGRRLADLAAIPADGVPWDLVEAEALARF